MWPVFLLPKRSSKINSLRPVATNFGEETADFLAGLLSAAFRLDGSGPVLALIGLLITIIFASNLFYWLKLALNSIWEVKPGNAPRSGMLAMLWNRMLAAVMVLLASLVLALTMVTRVITAELPPWLIERWPELAQAVWVIWQSIVVDTVLVTGLMMVAYKLLPDVPLSWRQVLPGALLVTVLFMIGTEAMKAYFSTDVLSTGLWSSRIASDDAVMGLLHVLHILLRGVVYTSLHATCPFPNGLTCRRSVNSAPRVCHDFQVGTYPGVKALSRQAAIATTLSQALKASEDLSPQRAKSTGTRRIVSCATSTSRTAQ